MSMSDGSNGSSNMNGRNRFPFTESQWEELEHQALIFKYMVSGIPIPPDLLFTIKRSCYFDRSPHSLKLFPNQHLGWNCFQIGLGRKIDPEPGRCRRTDGKKWRCSKEAYPDSKYCERHMHRGKNRSRKPVEPLARQHQDSFNLNSTHFFLGSPSASSSSSSSSSQRRSRYFNGVKKDLASSMDDSWQLTPLSMSSSSSSSLTTKERSCDYSSYLQLQLQSLTDDQIHTQKQQQLMDMVQAESESEAPRKTVHRFFDEWPPNYSRDKSSKTASLSTTSLSISIPSAHDFPIVSSGASRS